MVDFLDKALRMDQSQALFAEGLASPSLSSGLVSNAALFAQSLGLHRQRADIDAEDHSEALQRTWLFWAVYCTEKHIAQRCGQPSVGGTKTFIKDQLIDFQVDQ